jgi:RNA polymerase sigma factor (sigma-70 family)
MPPTAAETPDLVRRHGPEVMAVARRWAATPEDAEDAYQRGLEIMLTKAPSTDPDELVPWLKTVVKHECFAARRQRERHTPPAGMVPEQADSAGEGTAHDHAERLERLQLGAEAMGRLKPQEVRALVLRAEGLSYREICEETGWTYTKVNRALAEGRKAFAARLAGIESGAECERLAPLLSAVVDGEAGAEDLAALRPHLRSCLVCRARLRDYREAPARAAALVPPVAGLPLLAWVQERIASFAVRWQAVIEATSAHKLAAVTASTAVLAGGGVATVATVEDGVHHRPAPRAASRRADPPRAATTRTLAPATPPRRRRGAPTQGTARSKQSAAPEGPAKQSPPASGEFDPAPAGSAPYDEPSTPPPAGEAGEFAP